MRIARKILHRWAVVLLVCQRPAVDGRDGDRTGQRFDRLGHDLMCECGCGQMMLECNHVGCSSSEQMRKELKAALDRGDSDHVILAALCRPSTGQPCLPRPPPRASIASPGSCRS